MTYAATGWHHLGHRFGEVDSTMAIAQQLSSEGAPHGTWVLAERQTAGRGRRGRTWQSALRGGVYMTLLLRPPAAACLTGLPLVFAVAARDAILDALVAHGAANPGDDIGIKWPNDIVARGRKLGGILLEADDIGTARPSVRVGMGINVAPASSLALSPDVADRYVGATELVGFYSGEDPNRTSGDLPIAIAEGWVQALAAALVGRCAQAYTDWLNHGLSAIVEMWPKLDVLFNCRVEAKRSCERLVGIARGIGPDGRLRLLTACGPVWIDSGEIQASAAAFWRGDGLTKHARAVYVGLIPEAL